MAYQEGALPDRVSKDDEHDMIFVGFLVLFDPPKEGVADTIAELRALGVSSRSSPETTRSWPRTSASQVGLSSPVVLTGTDLHD